LIPAMIRRRLFSTRRRAATGGFGAELHPERELARLRRRLAIAGGAVSSRSRCSSGGSPYLVGRGRPFPHARRDEPDRDRPDRAMA
jgi:hypothetical protein